MDIKKFSSHGVFICLLLVLSAIHFYQKDLLAYTGDEPRFTYYAYSIAKGEMLKYPIEKFKKETGSIDPSHKLINTPITLNLKNKTMFMMNSIIAPLLYSPALFFGENFHAWQLLRTAAFIFYCAALIFIWLSLRTLFSIVESLLAISITVLSLPQLAQMSLANTEQIAIFFLAVAFYFLIFHPIKIIYILIGSLSMCLVVYSSMRAVPLAAAVGIGFLSRLWNQAPNIYFNKLKIFYIFIFISIAGGIGWVAMQVSFTGTIAGSSLLNESLIDKSPVWFLHRLFVPMLNHKNGIFLLFPLVFASLLGLINGARKKESLAGICLCAWLAYYFLISLTDQSEGYPARLLFPLVEFYIIGLAFFIRYFKNFAGIAVLVFGVKLSLIMMSWHFFNPTLLVQNREFGLFQQVVLNETKYLDYGKYLIWDKHSSPNSSSLLFLSDSWHIANVVIIYIIILGCLLLLSISNKNLNIKRLSNYSAFLLAFIATYSVFVLPVPKDSISIVRSFKDGFGSVKLNFYKPISGRLTITFGARAFWFPPEFPEFFSVIEETDGGTLKKLQKRSVPEIRLSGLDNVKSIVINGGKAKFPWSTVGVVSVFKNYF